MSTGTPTHITQNWLRSNCSDFINKDEWLSNCQIHLTSIR